MILTQCLSSTRSRIQARHGPSPVRYDAEFLEDKVLADATGERPVYAGARNRGGGIGDQRGLVA